MLEQWKQLPTAKQMQLAKQYGIKWYGTTEQQLEFELKTKLPYNFFPELVVEVEEPVEEIKDEQFVTVVESKSVKKRKKIQK